MSTMEIVPVELKKVKKSPATKKMVRITIELKKEIIAKYEGGLRIIDLAAAYNMPRTTISTIIKNKEAIKAANVAKGVKSISRQRSGTLERVEKLLLTWITEKQSAGETISESRICEQAKMIHADLLKDKAGTSKENEVFKASHGWFDNFKKRVGIYSDPKHQGAPYAVTSASNDIVTQCGDVMISDCYPPEQIYNTDEIAQFWKEMGNRTYNTPFSWMRINCGEWGSSSGVISTSHWAEVAKARWTNLRDLLHRELKNTAKVAEESGDSDAHTQWKHFQTMLLKDKVIKEENNSIPIEESSPLYPQTILEDGDEDSFNYQENGIVEMDSSRGSSTSHQDAVINQSNKRSSDEHFHSPTDSFSKRLRWNDDSDRHALVGNGENYAPHPMMDEDFHFLMSILPSIHRIKQERKTTFKMKILQLIMEEESETA